MCVSILFDPTTCEIIRERSQIFACKAEYLIGIGIGMVFCGAQPSVELQLLKLGEDASLSVEAIEILTDISELDKFLSQWITLNVNFLFLIQKIFLKLQVEIIKHSLEHSLEILFPRVRNRRIRNKKTT